MAYTTSYHLPACKEVYIYSKTTRKKLTGKSLQKNFKNWQNYFCPFTQVTFIYPWRESTTGYLKLILVK